MPARSIFASISVVALSSLLLSGCFEIEQSIELDRDMSGTADLAIGIDFEPMVLIMATMARQMEGKEGPPTQEELNKARAEFRAQNEQEKETNTPPSLDEANAELPEGIRLLNMEVEEKGLQVVSSFRLAFDTLSHLVKFELPSKSEGDQGPGEADVMSSPFENIELIDEGTSFTIRSKATNPTDSVEEQVAEQAPPDPAMEKMMEDAFRNLRYTWKIKAPFEVISHNATRVEGDTLIWTYDMERFKRMEAAGESDDMDIRVTYKKH